VTDREHYTPGSASGAQVRKDGEKWTLMLVRELRHSAENVWQALTEPAHLREWAPFDSAFTFRWWRRLQVTLSAAKLGARVWRCT
jgi:uncharacterized protein YndB with AHSA1/START domain